MQLLNELPLLFPRSLIGKWRASLESTYEDEGGKKECFRIYFDLVEE